MEWMSQEDTLFTLENGVEGVTYTIGENGLPVVMVTTEEMRCLTIT